MVFIPNFMWCIGEHKIHFFDISSIFNLPGLMQIQGSPVAVMNRSLCGEYVRIKAAYSRHISGTLEKLTQDEKSGIHLHIVVPCKGGI